jgi:hypothetical protein
VSLNDGSDFWFLQVRLSQVAYGTPRDSSAQLEFLMNIPFCHFLAALKRFDNLLATEHLRTTVGKLVFKAGR